MVGVPWSVVKRVPVWAWAGIGLAIALAAVTVAALRFAHPTVAPVQAVGGFWLVDQSTVVRLSGVVELQRPGTDDWEPVRGAQPLTVGDRVRTGPDGYAAFTFFDGSSTTLQPASELAVQRFERDPASGATAVILQQLKGSSWTRAGDNGHPFSGVLITTPGGARFFARGSQFETIVDAEGTYVTSAEGIVYGRAQNTDVEIPPGFSSRTLLGQAPEAPIPDPPRGPTLQVRVQGPARVLLTDARGRSVGQHPDSELPVYQIPFARVTETADGARVFSVPAPLEAYDLTLRGQATGTVQVAVGVLRPAQTSVPAAAVIERPVEQGEVLTTNFRWENEQVRGLQDLVAWPGAAPASAVALLRHPPPVVTAVLPTPAPEPTAEATEIVVAEPDPNDVFASLDRDGGLRPLVVAPAVPERPAVTTERPPLRAPTVPPPPPVVRAPERPAPVAEPTDPPTAPVVTLPPTDTPVVVMVTPVPPSPTPVPPTPVPPTPVPPTREPTVPPPLPTPVPTAPPTRLALPTRPVVTGGESARSVAPTATPVRVPYPGAGGLPVAQPTAGPTSRTH